MRVGFKSIACNLANILLTRLVGERQVLEIATLATRIQVARIFVTQHIEMGDSAKFKAVFTVALSALVGTAAGDLGIFWRTDGTSGSAGRARTPRRTSRGSRPRCSSCSSRPSRGRRPGGDNTNAELIAVCADALERAFQKVDAKSTCTHSAVRRVSTAGTLAVC